MLSQNLELILKDNIILPKVELKHCNKLFDYFSDIRGISNYNFTENKITICFNKIKDNGRNHGKDPKSFIIEALFLKEFSYFSDFNLTYANKKLSLSDKAKITIQACRFEINHILKDKKLNSGIFENKLEDEFIKRCSYLDFKYKFFDDLEFEASKADENINQLVKRLIDSNFF